VSQLQEALFGLNRRLMSERRSESGPLQGIKNTLGSLRDELFSDDDWDEPDRDGRSDPWASPPRRSPSDFGAPPRYEPRYDSRFDSRYGADLGPGPEPRFDPRFEPRFEPRPESRFRSGYGAPPEFGPGPSEPEGRRREAPEPRPLRRPPPQADDPWSDG
jgi:molecular chaperone DnaK